MYLTHQYTLFLDSRFVPFKNLIPNLFLLLAGDFVLIFTTLLKLSEVQPD